VFFIFGFQRKPHRLATISARCASCQDRSAQELFSVRTRFRLFFVPAVPLPTTYRTRCAECRTSVTVSAEKADLLLASVPPIVVPPVTAVPAAEGAVVA
jgi:hypothetical protein